MRSLALLLLLVAGCQVVPLQRTEEGPFAGPAPLVVWIEENPWLMVIGSDTPMLALYENGDLITLTQSEEGNHFYRARRQLSPDELAMVIKKISNHWKSDYSDRYSLTEASSQTTTKIFSNLGGELRTVSIYGLETPGSGKLPSDLYEGDQEVPRGLRHIHETLYELSLAKAESWLPDTYEVMAWPYEYAPEESVKWPDEWPGLAEAVRRRSDFYLIYMERDRIGEVYELLNRRKEKGAVEIDGRKMAVSVRPVFPSEPVWRNAFSKPKSSPSTDANPNQH